MLFARFQRLDAFMKKTKLSNCIIFSLMSNLVVGYCGLALSTFTHAYDSYYWGTQNPTSSPRPYGKGRFGEYREKSDRSKDYGHQGVDISVSGKLFAYADSTVLNVDSIRGGGNQVILQPKDHKDVIAVYWHLSRHAPGLTPGKEVKGGAYVGDSGQTGLNCASCVHLHFGAGFSDQSKALNIWLGDGKNNSYGNRSSVIRSSVFKRAAKVPSRPQYYWGNPALLLPMDVGLGTANPTSLNKYLGNSMRSQYNALVRNPRAMPLGAGYSMGSAWQSIPVLKANYSGIPSDIASQNAQQAIANVLVNSTEAEQALGGAAEVTPEQFAMYAPPRTFFTGESTVAIDVGDGGISENELVDKIGTARFHNGNYQAELMDTSMRGMLTDYLNTINSKNYLKKLMYFQKQRIEALYAAWNSQIVKYNLNGELANTVERAQQAQEIPIVSRMPLVEIYERYDQGIMPSLAQLSTALPVGFSGMSTCHPSAMNGWNRLPNEYKKRIIILALKMGADPNTLAILMAYETINYNFNLIYASSGPSGLVQFTPTGVQSMKMWGLLNEYYPESHQFTKQAYGRSKITNNAQVARNHPRNFLIPAKNAGTIYEFMYYDAYFFSKKIFENGLDGKDMTTLYKSIFGFSPYHKNAKSEIERRRYEENKQADVAPQDGIVSAQEILLTKNFRDRACQYISDDDILNNRYGITNADLNMPYASRYGIYQPKIGSYGGLFAARLSAMKLIQENENAKSN